jgi:hypothetical protein
LTPSTWTAPPACPTCPYSLATAPPSHSPWTELAHSAWTVSLLQTPLNQPNAVWDLRQIAQEQSATVSRRFTGMISRSRRTNGSNKASDTNCYGQGVWSRSPNHVITIQELIQRLSWGRRREIHERDQIDLISS